MTSVIVGAIISIVATQVDTTVILGAVQRDLTGDGRPELLQLVGKGRTLDSLAVTLLIKSTQREVFRAELAPITRFVGFDAARKKLTVIQHRAQLQDIGNSFFDARKFRNPDQFIDWLQGSARSHVGRIPKVLAADRRYQLRMDSLKAAGRRAATSKRHSHQLQSAPLDTVTAKAIWGEIQRAGVTLFEFSEGGDKVTAIAWSGRDRRFYRILECC